MPSIALRSERSELSRLGTMVEQFGAEHHLSDDSIVNINLVLDEIVANVIRHGGLESDDRIEVSFGLDRSIVSIEVADAGIPFDPMAAPPPNLEAPIEERRSGGLGIHIVKSLAETVAYRREGERNYLSATVRVETT